MANKRTAYTITADLWVRVINGKSSAKIRKKTTATYYCMEFDDAGDTPPDQNPQTIDTAEKMFLGNDLDDFIQDSAPVYFWVRCLPGETGKVVVTE